MAKDYFIRLPVAGFKTWAAGRVDSCQMVEVWGLQCLFAFLGLLDLLCDFMHEARQ